MQNKEHRFLHYLHEQINGFLMQEGSEVFISPQQLEKMFNYSKKQSKQLHQKNKESKKISSKMLVDQSFEAFNEEKELSQVIYKKNTSLDEDKGIIKFYLQADSEIFFAEGDLNMVYCLFDQTALDLLIPGCKRDYKTDFESIFLNDGNIFQLLFKNEDRQLEKSLLETKILQQEFISFSDIMILFLKQEKLNTQKQYFYISADRQKLFPHIKTEVQNQQNDEEEKIFEEQLQSNLSIKDKRNQRLKKKISMQNLNRIESMQKIGSMQLIQKVKSIDQFEQKFQIQENTIKQKYIFKRQNTKPQNKESCNCNELVCLNGLIKTELDIEYGNDKSHFELQMQSLEYDQDGNPKEIQITIRDISNIIARHKKLMHSIYKDATLLNYSHEQLTPLNSILNNSKILIQFISNIKDELDAYSIRARSDQDEPYELEIRNAIKIQKKSTILAMHVQNSAQILDMHCQNQIQLQKFKNNQLDFEAFSSDPETQINFVLQTFIYQIQKKKIQTRIFKDQAIQGLELWASWKLYKLIFFNVFQNAVKYNSENGQIIITLFIEYWEEQEYLITEVKDTGKGIENDRVKYLFKTFGELSSKQFMKKVVDYGIGLGLSCSKELSKAINGDIQLVSSKKGQTIFRIKTPLNVLGELKKRNAKEQSDNQINRVSSINSIINDFESFRSISNIGSLNENSQQSFKSDEKQQFYKSSKKQKKLSRQQFQDLQLDPIIEDQDDLKECLANFQNQQKVSDSLSSKNDDDEILNLNKQPVQIIQDYDEEQKRQNDYQQIEQFQQEYKNEASQNVSQPLESEKQINIISESINDSILNSRWHDLQESLHVSRLPPDFPVKSPYMQENNVAVSVQYQQDLNSKKLDQFNLDKQNQLLLNSIIQNIQNQQIQQKNESNLNENSQNINKIKDIEVINNIFRRNTPQEINELIQEVSQELESQKDAKKQSQQSKKIKQIINKSVSISDVIIQSNEENSFQYYIFSSQQIQELEGQIQEEQKQDLPEIQEEVIEKIDCECSNKILIVDDNPFNLQVLKELIQSQTFNPNILAIAMEQDCYQDLYQNPIKFTAETAENGKQGVDQYAKNLTQCQSLRCKGQFKLIIMDLGMPIMDGFQASEQIFQQQNELRQMLSESFEQLENDLFFEMNCCEIIALTAFTDKETNDRCIQIGMKEVLNKPIQFNHVKRLILRYHFKLNQDQYLLYLQKEKEILQKQ